ncbi:transaldolase [Candidatus Woesearchaeota archaeon]|nr:transaldolase [Candidatus Woesearchaeota archaeon]
MKIYVDTADIDEIKEAFSWGIVDGVTTNPSLIKKAVQKHGGDVAEYIKQILTVAGDCPVSLEVIGLDEASMLREARRLYSKFNDVSKNVVVKIPVNPATSELEKTHYHGLKVIKRLHETGVKTNATLIMTPEQALLAAKAGAEYVSPFAGRIDDDLRKKAGLVFSKTDYFNAMGIVKKETREILHDDGIVSGVDLVRHCVEILKKHGYSTEVIAASLRNARQVREIALIGSQIATVPFPVLTEMMTHPKTHEGVIAFKNDVVDEYKEVFE